MLRVITSSLLILAFGSVAGTVKADARDRLIEFQNQVKAFSARFQQVVTDENGAVIQDSAGSVVLARPFRFRWDYSTPYEQLIVSDGTNIWFYDADLEQVTVKSVDSTLGNSAALILSASRPLEENFNLSSQANRGEIQWVLATPRKDSGNFRRIRIGFRGRDPSVMELTDSFGQSTRLKFSEFRRNPPVSAREFEFVAPAGVDVLRSND